MFKAVIQKWLILNPNRSFSSAAGKETNIPVAIDAPL
jgi:hypothetical protein